MMTFTRGRMGLTGMAGLAIAATTLQPATQQALADGHEGSMVSAYVAFDFNTHFMSSGLDVWSTGNDFSDNIAFNPSIDIALDFETFALNFGTWWDVNNNTAAAIGGQLQEVDVWLYASTSVDDFSFSVGYQAWFYGGGTENIYDIGISYDDSELWGEDGIALNPSVLFRHRGGATNVTAPNGWVASISIAPGTSFELTEDQAVDVSFPVTVGFVISDEGYHVVDENGFAWFSIGVSASTPLTFIPAEYGAWDLHGGLAYFITDEDTIGNTDDDFLTGSIGIGMAF